MQYIRIFINIINVYYCAIILFGPSITVIGRRQRAEEDSPAGVSLVAFGVHAVPVVRAVLRRDGFRFVQVPAGQRRFNQLFRFRFGVRLVSSP